MREKVNLLEGSIGSALVRLALPIMGTSLIQMAYNLTDMIWIGRISSNAVAAVGAAGLYIWMSAGLALLISMGGQVLLGQFLGAGQKEEARKYARVSLQMGIVFGLLFGLICILGNRILIGFFHLNSPEVIRDARWYLIITCGMIIFNFLNQILTGLLTAMGNSGITFRSTTIGLVINIILDPLFIFGFGPVPGLGAVGAAIATVIAQIIVFTVYFFHIRHDTLIFQEIHLLKLTEFQYFRQIITIGFPAAVQSMLMTVTTMVIARMISGWGDVAVAVQKVGGQIESISWMTAAGFGSAVNAFTAQNYGAKKKDRVRKGYHTGLAIMFAWGCFTTFVLMAFPEFLFKIFIREPEVLPLGVDYLRILGVSQLFMCLEAAATGAFQGLGKTTCPSVVGTVWNLLRIPMAMLLGATALKLNGVWWAISISSIMKGIITPIWLRFTFKKMGGFHDERRTGIGSN